MASTAKGKEPAGIASAQSKESETRFTPKDNGASSELAAVVDELLNNLTTKFTSVSNEMTSKMDDMGRRIDALEAALQAQQGSTKPAS